MYILKVPMGHCYMIPNFGDLSPGTHGGNTRESTGRMSERHKPKSEHKESTRQKHKTNTHCVWLRAGAEGGTTLMMPLCSSGRTRPERSRRPR